MNWDTTKRFKFKRVGNMSYEVWTNTTDLPEPSEFVGTLWRGREQNEWNGRTALGQPVEYYGISRDTAAGCLSREDLP